PAGARAIVEPLSVSVATHSVPLSASNTTSSFVAEVLAENEVKEEAEEAEEAPRAASGPRVPRRADAIDASAGHDLDDDDSGTWKDIGVSGISTM
ncbi:hypothetical protein T492DRAFT_882095, partial [Pavlovales sp. CCMP2436]